MHPRAAADEVQEVRSSKALVSALPLACGLRCVFIVSFLHVARLSPPSCYLRTHTDTHTHTYTFTDYKLMQCDRLWATLTQESR